MTGMSFLRITANSVPAGAGDELAQRFTTCAGEGADTCAGEPVIPVDPTK